MNAWSRRGMMGGALSAATLAACATPSGDDALVSLNALARTKGMRFGASLGMGGDSDEFGDPRYLDLVRRECGLLVAENEHKWPALHPRFERYDFSRPDAMMAWADDAGVAFRGHNLVWHHPNWLPRYINEHDFGANPRAEAERILRDHITTVCAHYSTRIQSWDVINETIDPENGQLRETVFTRAAGFEINDFIFRTAREAAPHSQLVYNDYMSWEHWSANHRDGVLRALEAWLGRGVPIDALGIQAHIGTDNNYQSAAEFNAGQEYDWRVFLDEVTGMGLDLLITELDVHDKGLPSEIAPRDRAVADYTKAYLDITLSYPQLKDVLAWGLVDKYSWLQDRFPREDGLEKRVCPYDSNYQPKPMRDAIAAALSAAPPR